MKSVLNSKLIGYALSFMTLAIVMIFSTQVMAAEVNKAIVNTKAPDFTLTDTDGVIRSLSDFAGKTVVLEWTNHECPYVRKHYETKNMQTLQKEARDAGVVWLVINSSAPGMQGNTTTEEARIIMQKEGSNETARLLDPTGEVGRLYDARTTPHMYVINKDGILVYAGAIDNNPSSRHDTVENADNYVRDALKALDAGEKVTVSQTQPYGCSVKYKL